MDKQALNRKLAEWAGFKQIESRGLGVLDGGFSTHKVWSYPNLGGDHDDLPDFTDSLDVCFKWLVPKLEPLGFELEISNDAQMLGWGVCLCNQHSAWSIASPYESFSEPSGTALALCLAIEKLIDGGDK